MKIEVRYYIISQLYHVEVVDAANQQIKEKFVTARSLGHWIRKWTHQFIDVQGLSKISAVVYIIGTYGG